ncbi:MAG: glycosyl hydrolase, partial [Planctomycetes bacterium]|nr:glycosyl hydrolase [Planctomycetota bacterium]
MTRRSLTPLLAVSTFSLTIAMVASPLVAQEEAVKKPVEIESDTFSGLRARSIGPALTSGRVGDFAVNPDDPKHYFVAVSSGNVWKTVNGGITYEPVFDNYGSYSIGCVEMDPTKSNVVWFGAGE